MYSITLHCRTKAYKHLTVVLLDLLSFREENCTTMTQKELDRSYNNEEFLNKHLTKISSQIVAFTVDKFNKGEL